MTPAYLRRLVARGEGPVLEFKRTTGELREAMEALCGMLNGVGSGRVLFGVSDKGDLLGQTVSDSTQREIANATRRIEPSVEVRTMLVPLRARQAVVVVEASGGPAGPFTFEGRGYLRVGNTTQRMSHSEFDSRVVKRLQKETPWDRWIAPDWKVRHLDRDEVLRTVEDAVEAKRLTGVLGEKWEVVLRRLELVTDDGVTRAAAILFGKEGGPGFPMGEVRLARFRGVTKDEFRDNRQFKGHAFALLQHAERFLEEHEPVASHFVEGRMRRVDTPLYPPLAVREALVNALVHRDYSIDGGAVSMALFDDRLEIWSTGTLPEGVTPEKLKGTHGSIPRNRLIADVFHRRGLIERWGRGTNKILAEAEKLGCPEPEFEEIAGAFVVRFRPAKQAGALVPPPGLGLRAGKVLSVVHRLGPIRASAILKELGEPIAMRTLQRELRRLRAVGVIIAIGRGEATIYRVGEGARS
ncbi:MAG: putative DNA binding domain-containing protein [Planctomycetes bacterium]|nr:putative DNA binding domain-containing protein [Planctomycetota bacterium]